MRLNLWVFQQKILFNDEINGYCQFNELITVKMLLPRLLKKNSSLLEKKAGLNNALQNWWATNQSLFADIRESHKYI